MRPHRVRVALSAVFASLLGLTVGCGLSIFQLPEKSVPAGTARATVVSVIPWQEIRDKLAPKFNLPNGDTALAKVAPVVQAENDVFTRSLSFIASAGVATGSPEAKAAALNSVAATAFPGDGGVTLSGVSPITQYALAAALYQEVQLLNESVSYFEAQNREVFLVATDIALLPRRSADYDAEVLLSFIPSPEANNEGTRIESIPIISQDDVELSQHARAVEDAVQLAFALSAMGTVKQTPGEILSTLGFSSDELRRTLGRDINSLQVVGRASRESIVVRFGAALTVEPAHTLFPQTRRVYSLLIVPRDLLPGIWKRDGNPLYAVSSVRFMDETGTEIDANQSPDLKSILAKVCKQNPTLEKPDEVVAAIWARYQTGLNLAPKLRKYCIAEMNDEQIRDRVPWLRHALAAATASEKVSWSPIFVPPPVQDRLATHDGTSVHSVVRGGNVTLDVPGRSLSDDRARWVAKPAPPPGTDALMVLPKDVKRISSDIVQLTFPAEAFCTDEKTCATGELLYRAHPRIDPGTGNWCTEPATCIDDQSPYYGNDWQGAKFVIRKIAEPAAPTPLVLTITNSPVACEANGSAVAVVELRPPEKTKSEEKMTLRLSGASALLLDANDRPATEVAVTIPKDATMYRAILPLRSLVPGQTLTVQAWDNNGKKQAEAIAPIVARENPGEYRGTK